MLLIECSLPNGNVAALEASDTVPEALRGEADWARCDAAGTVLARGRAVLADAFRQRVAGEPVFVLLHAAVALHRVFVPGRSARLREQALPYVLEELVTADLDTLRVVSGPELGRRSARSSPGASAAAPAPDAAGAERYAMVIARASGHALALDDAATDSRGDSSADPLADPVADPAVGSFVRAGVASVGVAPTTASLRWPAGTRIVPAAALLAPAFDDGWARVHATPAGAWVVWPGQAPQFLVSALFDLSLGALVASAAEAASTSNRAAGRSSSRATPSAANETAASPDRGAGGGQGAGPGVLGLQWCATGVAMPAELSDFRDRAGVALVECPPAGRDAAASAGAANSSVLDALAVFAAPVAGTHATTPPRLVLQEAWLRRFALFRQQQDGDSAWKTLRPFRMAAALAALAVGLLLLQTFMDVQRLESELDAAERALANRFTELVPDTPLIDPVAQVESILGAGSATSERSNGMPAQFAEVARAVAGSSVQLRSLRGEGNRFELDVAAANLNVIESLRARFDDARILSTEQAPDGDASGVRARLAVEFAS